LHDKISAGYRTVSYPGKGVVVAKGEGLTTRRDACTEMEQVAVRMKGTGKGFSSLEKRKEENKARKC
jgi:hypothetical protein